MFIYINLIFILKRKMKFHINQKIIAPHEHSHHPKSIEFIIAIIIAVTLIASLTSEQYLTIPRYLVPLLIVIFIGLKLVHIIKQGGTLLEDYTTIAVMIIFVILHIALKGNLNALLITVFIAILLYSTGLMFWVRSTLGSKKITHFLTSYITTLFMIIFLFAGAYLSNPEEFINQGIKKSITFEDALYFSTVTITTVGYGDITPLKINKFFAATEAFIGMVVNIALLGYILSLSRLNSQ